MNKLSREARQRLLEKGRREGRSRKCIYQGTGGKCILELPPEKRMGKTGKSIKFCLSFVMMFIVSAVLIGNVVMPVKAAVPETYTTIFDTNGGECEVGSITVERGESLTLPTASLEGFHFLGWLERIVLDDGGGYLFQVWPAGYIFTPKEDGPLFAVWKIVVAFEPEGGECAETEIMVGQNEEITLPDASREGFNFTGWYKDGNLQEYAGGAGEGYLPERNVTLYAGWEEKEKRQFTITFHAGGGICDETTVLVEEGTAVTLPEASREGYEFTGWYKDGEFIEYVGAVGEDYTPDGDSGLYAGWKDAENKGDDDKEPDKDAGEDGNNGEGNNTENPPAESGTGGAGNGEGTEGVSENEVHYLDTAVNLNSGYEETEDKENVESADESPADVPGAENTSGGQAEAYGAQEDMGRMTEPVIQTGRVSLVPAAVIIGVYGVLFVAAACVPGKKKRDGKK